MVYVSKKLQSEQDEINGIVASLGGQFRWQYVPDVTHFVFTGKAKDLSKEFRQAKKDGKHIVGPGWIKMCRDEQKLVEEELFPHTYNPKMTLDISVMSQANNTRRMTRKKADAAALSQTKMEEDDNEEAATSPKKTRRSRGSKSEQDDDEDMEDTKLLERKSEDETNPSEINEHLAKLDQLMDASNQQQKASPQTRRSMKMALTSAEATPDRSADDKTLNKHDKSSAALSSQNPDSQAIQWKDPKEEVERQKLIAKMEKESQALNASEDGGSGGHSMVSRPSK